MNCYKLAIWRTILCVLFVIFYSGFSLGDEAGVNPEVVEDVNPEINPQDGQKASEDFDLADAIPSLLSHLSEEEAESAVPLKYITGFGYAVDVLVGGQPLTLAISSTTCGILLFEDGEPICHTGSCYKPKESTTSSWCKSTKACFPGIRSFQCEEVSSPDGIKEATKLKLTFNGHAYTLETLEGFETFEIKNAAQNTLRTFDKLPVKLARRYISNSIAPKLDGIHGVLGIAGREFCCRSPSIWHELITPFSGYYVINLSHVKEKGDGYIGMGITRDMKEEAVWSERKQIGSIYTNALLEFTLYNFTLCGIQVLGQTSTNWEAIIDLSSEFITLPKNFWITLMTYLPVETSCFLDVSGPRICKLRKDTLHPLPSLEFNLAYKRKGFRVTIALEHLLMENEDGSQSIRIIPQDEGINASYTTTPTIKLGYRALYSLTLIVDTAGNRVGFINKDRVTTSDIACIPQAKCTLKQKPASVVNLLSFLAK